MIFTTCMCNLSSYNFAIFPINCVTCNMLIQLIEYAHQSFYFITNLYNLKTFSYFNNNLFDNNKKTILREIYYFLKKLILSSTQVFPLFGLKDFPVQNFFGNLQPSSSPPVFPLIEENKEFGAIHAYMQIPLSIYSRTSNIQVIFKYNP